MKSTPFLEFSQFLEQLEVEPARNKLTEIISDFLSKLEKPELSEALYLMDGRVAAAYEPIELNFSDKSFLNSIRKLTPSVDTKELYKELGDSGLVAERLVASGKFEYSMLVADKKSLAISEIFQKLVLISTTTGEGSVEKKSAIVLDLMLHFSAIEAKYFGRIVTGNLRLGVSSKTVLDAISRAKSGDKSLRAALNRAYGVRADIGKLAEYVLVDNLDLNEITLELGVPLAAELVERESDVNAILTRHPKAIVQPKYDGLRAQVHWNSTTKTIKVFSRNMEPLTDMFPELPAALEKLSIKSMVFDSEAIGYEASTDSFLPFQQTIQRKRKYDVASVSENIPVRFFMFDLLYLDGKDLTQKPLAERLELLESIDFSAASQLLVKTDSRQFTDVAELDVYFRGLLSKGLEGIIAKDPASTYRPGERSYDWIKLKANTFAELKDTVDTVIMGYYRGRGNRAIFGIGGFLVGVFNAEANVYQTIAKVGSGVKEDEWPVFKARLDELAIKEMPSYYQIESTLMPDVLVAPEIVMEVDADEITLSSNHTAGRNSDFLPEGSKEIGQGYSLRFPRLKVFARDKKAEQSTSLQELKTLFTLGGKKKGSN